MKKLMMAAVAMVSAVAMAAPRKPTAMAGNEDGPVTTGRAAKVNIIQEPRLGEQTCLGAPGIGGGSLIGQCYKKPRQWIVLETSYSTAGTEKSRFLDQLTFTWHVLLETKQATENKGNKEGLAPYSYFSTSVTYQNIPFGTHAASVVLPPSYRERYGVPKAVGLEITNENGDMLAGNSWSEVKGIKGGTKFWEDNKIMDAKMNGEPMIERRQGLVDRSKTIWALVNPNDYEYVAQ